MDPIRVIVTNQPVQARPPSQPPYSETIQAPAVLIDGIPVIPQFSGLAPFFAGLYQVNVQVPDTTPSGNAV